MRNQRKFSNMRLTRQYHFRHMGLWMVISVLLVIILNVLLYLVALQQWGLAGAMADEYSRETVLFRRGLLTVLSVEALLFAIALVLLARSTSHRIAGAFLALQKTCDRIASGERGARQHFRKYDGLGDLERSFNAMLDSLTGGGKKT